MCDCTDDGLHRVQPGLASYGDRCGQCDCIAGSGGSSGVVQGTEILEHRLSNRGRTNPINCEKTFRQLAGDWIGTSAFRVTAALPSSWPTVCIRTCRPVTASKLIMFCPHYWRCGYITMAVLIYAAWALYFCAHQMRGGRKPTWISSTLERSCDDDHFVGVRGALARNSLQPGLCMGLAWRLDCALLNSICQESVLPATCDGANDPVASGEIVVKWDTAPARRFDPHGFG